ncbi:MAG: class II aldolase/adducin family protein [Gemmatimonadaceae bacterium]
MAAGARLGDARAREQIVAACRRLYDRGLIAGAEGNVSVRVAPARLLITPAGVPKADLRPSDLVVTDGKGRVARGMGQPSTELAMHLRIYRCRSDIHAVVHAHPPVATGFAVCGEAFAESVLPEVVVALGPIALVPYATPGTETLADRIEPLLADHDVFLLSNHGATTVGSTVEVAYARMESLEHSARILLAARLLGQVRTLTAEQVRDLVAARERVRSPGP